MKKLFTIIISLLAAMNLISCTENDLNINKESKNPSDNNSANNIVEKKPSDNETVIHTAKIAEVNGESIVTCAIEDTYVGNLNIVNIKNSDIYNSDGNQITADSLEPGMIVDISFN